MRSMQQHRAQGKLAALGVLSIVLAMVVLPGVSQAADPQPKVTEGKLVSLEYTLTLDDKTVVDSNVGDKPLTYTHGSHQIIPGLEKALEGMAVGDTKQVTVAPTEGYGETDPKARHRMVRWSTPWSQKSKPTQLSSISTTPWRGRRYILTSR